MKPSEYFDLKQHISTHSNIHCCSVDCILEKLHTDDLKNLKYILEDFYNAGIDEANDAGETYSEGYDAGFDVGYSEGFYDGSNDD